MFQSSRGTGLPQTSQLDLLGGLRIDARNLLGSHSTRRPQADGCADREQLPLRRLHKELHAAGASEDDAEHRRGHSHVGPNLRIAGEPRRCGCKQRSDVESNVKLISCTNFQNLTEYNTAHNRKISLGITESFVAKKGTKRKRVHFNEDEIVINPEDIDDSIGKFRNLVQSTVVPMSNKRMRLDGSSNSFSFPSTPHIEQKQILHHPIISAPNLYAGLPSTSNEPVGEHHSDESFNSMYASTLLPALPNPAPDIEVSSKPMTLQVQFKNAQHLDHEPMDFDLNEPKATKKKYAKEAWPKKAPKSHLGDI